MNALRRCIGSALLAGLLLAPGTLLAQTAGTFTFTATANNGDRDPQTPGLQVDEGDTVTITSVAHGLTAGNVGYSFSFSGTINRAVHTDTNRNLNNDRVPVHRAASADEGTVYTIMIRDDTDAEGDETIIATPAGLLGNPTPTFTLPPPITVTILANDGASQAAIGGADATVAEGAALNVPITFTGAARTAASSVTFAITGTATSADYSVDDSGAAITFDATAATGTATVPHTDSGGSIPITVASDSSDDDGETIIVTLTGHTGGGADVTGFYSSAARTYTTAEGTTFTITAGPATITETDADLATAAYTITRSGAALTAATAVTWMVEHADTGGTADADFEAVTGMVNFAAGEDTQTFTLTIRGDNLNEDGESFSLLVSASGHISGDNYAVTISDDDAIELAHTGAATASEGSSASVNVQLGATASSEITVAYTLGSTAATTDVDAAAADYTAGSGSIAIAAGADGGAISIPVIADNLNESAETFTVSVALSGVTGGFGTVGGIAVAHTFTIPASDPVSASIAAPTPPAVNEGATATFAITLSGATAGLGQDLTITYTAGGITDTPTDAGSGSLTLAAGATLTGSIAIGIPLNAMLDEDDPDETLTVTLTGITGGGGGSIAAAPGNSADVTVSYQAAAHNFSFSSPATSIAEGAAATTYTVTRSGPAIVGANIVVAWNYSAGTAAAEDFMGDTAPNGNNLVFSGTETSKTFSIATKEDSLNEAGETFSLRLTNPGVATAYDSEGGVAFGSAVAVTITDDDTIMVAITADAASAVESGTADFTITLSGGARTADVVAPFSVGGLDAAEFAITAPGGLAASAVAGSVTFTAATTNLTATISVNLLDDALNEASETLTVMGGEASSAGAVAYTSGGGSASVMVTDDDALVAHIALTSPASGGVNEGGRATYSVTLRSGAAPNAPVATSAGEICLPFSAVVNGQQPPANSATSGADIALVAPHNATCAARNAAVAPNAVTGAATASVLIAEGQSSASFQIEARFDNLDEGATAEMLRVALESPAVPGSGAGAVTVASGVSGQASVNINNINAARTLSVAADSASAAEGGNAVFSVSVAGAPVTAAFQVAWTLAGTAAAADTSGPASGTLNFAASDDESQTQMVTIPVVDDALNEGPETLMVTLTDPCGAGICAAGGRPGNLPPDAPALQLTGGSATATIAASDPIRVTLARRGGDTGRLVNGGAANFVATLGATASTEMMLQITAMAGSTAIAVPNVAVASGATEVAFSIPPCSAPAVTTGCLDAADLAASGEVQLAVSVSGITGAPSGATAAPDAANAAAANIGVVGWELSIAPVGSAAAPTTIGEGGAFALEVTLRGAPAPTALMIPWSVAGSGARPAAAADFPGGAFPGDTLDLSGASSATITVQTMTDTEDESSGAEGFAVTLNAFTGANAAAVAAAERMAYAQISDALRTLAVGAVTATLSEDAVTAAGVPAATAQFTITMDGTEPPVEAVQVTWRLNSPGGSLTLQPSAAGRGRNFQTADLAPGAALMGTVTFPAGVALPETMRVEVPIAQDALNEGAEQLQLTLDAVDEDAGGRRQGTADSIPATLVSQAAATVTVSPSDPIVLSVRRTGDGTVVSGGSITFVASFGATTVNGVETPIAPTTDLTIALPIMGGDDPNQVVTLTAAAGETTATLSVPKNDIAASGTPRITVGTPRITVTGTADAPPGGADVPTPTDTGRLPAPVQTAAWSLARTLPGGREAPEGADYRVVFRLEGTAAPTALSFAWRVAGSPGTGGGAAAVVGDFNCAAAGETPRACTSADGFPSGTVRFAAGDSTQTIRIAILDDGQDEGMQPGGGAALPEGFTLTLDALSGANAGDVEFADSDSRLPGTLQVDIPALRADLRVADATAAEGADAVFALSLGNFSGGAATTLPVTVSYRVGETGDSAERGVDYRAGDSVETVTIAPGAASAEIAISLLQDGVLEPRETFTLTITDAAGGGGTIRLVNAAGEQRQITATGTITDDADQQARRMQRVGALVTVLDRQTAMMATDAITARLNRSRADAGAQFSIANRNLLGGGNGAETAQSADDSNIGLALYGAAGQGGATAGAAGLGGGGGSGVSGASAGGGNYTGGDAFAGLGAGLAGGANMGSQTALPSLAELMNGSSFAFQGALSNLAEGVQVWGSGGFANLEGNPQSSRASLDYDGDTIAAFLGADSQVRGNLLAGFALGWASGDLDFTDRAGSFTMDGSLSNDMLSLHPYLGWQVTPNLNAWLVLGFGFGSVDISEHEGSGASRISRTLDGGDSNMLMFAAGFAGQRQFANATDLKLRFQVARVSSDVDSARFDDGALLPATRGRNARIGGALELGHRFSFGGVALRPFGTLGLRLDNNGSASAASARRMDEGFDVGGGVTAAWPALGLDGRAEFSLQINNSGHEEQRASLDLSFDPGADSRGLTLALQTALRGQRSGLPNAASGRSGLGSLASPLTAGVGEMQRSLSGELGYGVAMRQFGRAALLTPYGRFNLGSTEQRWAAGLRLAQPGNSGLQLGLEAGIDLESTRADSATNPARSYDLLLTGRLRF